MKRRTIGIIAAIIMVMLMMPAAAFAEAKAGQDAGQAKRTIMFYVCGSDLESRAGLASFNLRQILSANFSKDGDVNFIVLTGGAGKWHLEKENLVFSADNLPTDAVVDDYGTAIDPRSQISNNYNQIWEAHGADAAENPGKLVLKDGDGITMGTPVKSSAELMSSPKTLKTFIDYCAENYPAEKYDLIMWDHGNGAAGGFAYDEHVEDYDLDDSSPMPIAKITNALRTSKVVDANGDGTQDGKFDFVNFDACLMGSVECNLLMADYTDYYIASPEVVPGHGEEYSGWLNMLGENKDVDTYTLGCKLVDDFYEFYQNGEGKGDEATLAIVDMKKLLESGFSEALTEMSNLMREQAEQNKFFDELQSANGAIRYTDKEARDVGNLASMISVVQTEISEEELDGSDISYDNVYKNAGMKICSILDNDEIIHARGTKGIKSLDEQLYRGSDGQIQYDNLRTSGMYLYFPVSGGFWGIDLLNDYYREITKAIEAMPVKDDGRYAFFKDYLDTVIDYSILTTTGGEIDNMINGDDPISKSKIDYAAVKKYMDYEWDQTFEVLFKLRKGGEAGAKAWMESLVKLQAEEAIDVKNISAKKVKQKNGRGWQIRFADTKRRTILSVSRGVFLELPNLQKYINHNYDDEERELIQDAASLQAGFIDGEMDIFAMPNPQDATIVDWIHWYNGKDSTWFLSAPEKMWYAVKDANGELHVAVIESEDDNSYTVTARIGNGETAQPAQLKFIKTEESAVLSSISIVTEAGSRPIRPEELESCSIATALYVFVDRGDEYDELYLPVSEAFEFNPEDTGKISLVYTDMDEIHDIGDTDGDGSVFSSVVGVDDIYQDGTEITDILEAADEEMTDIDLVRVKPAIYTGDPVTPEVVYRGATLEEGTDYTIRISDEDWNELDGPVTEPGLYHVTLLGKGSYYRETIKDFQVVYSEAVAEALVAQAENEYAEAKDAMDEAVASGDAEALQKAYAKLINAQNALSEAKDELDRTKTALSVEKQAELDDRIEDLEEQIDYLTKELAKAEIVDISNFQVNMKTSFVYSGKAVRPAVKVSGISSDDYKVYYSANTKVGTATVTIKADNPYYKGKITRTFKIVPKKAVVAKANAGKKKLTVKAKTKVAKTGGTMYQIQYRVKGTSKWKTKKTKKQSLTIKKLKKGKKYQVRIRAFKKVGKKTYYGAWSKVKTTKKIK